MRRIWTLAGLIAVALSLSAPVARAAGSHESPKIEVTSLSVVAVTGRAELVIAVDGAVDMQDFSLGSPPRVVLDLRGARLGVPPRLYDRVPRGGILNVRIAQYREDVVRIVLDLDIDRKYTVTRGEHEVRISIEGSGTPSFASWNVAGPRLAVASANPAATASLVVAHASPGEVAPQQPRTAGQKITSRNRLRDVGVAVAGKVDEPRITVTYQDADIRDVLAAFAVFSGRTIVVGKGVTGTVSAEIRDQPWDVALRAILQAQGLAAREDQDGIITVDSYDNIAAQQATEPLTTQIIAVNYTNARSLVETVKSLLSQDCGNRSGASGPSAGGAAAGQCRVRGSVSADSSTNRLVITDVASRIQDIASYIKDLDLRTPQIAIKAKIIFVNRTNIEDLGIAYDLGTSGQFFNKLVQRTDPTTLKPIDTNGDGIPDALGGGTSFNQNLNVVEIGGNALSGIANANQRVVQPALELIFSTAIGKFNLSTFIDALQEVRLADIQAEPSVTTLDNRRAEILSGEETPIRIIDLGTQAQAQGGQQQQPRATVSFKQTGINLAVTPHVTNNRQILMVLHAERSNLQAAASDLGFTFQTQKADNQLLVNDGETAVIGGLTVTQLTSSRSGIPILVDLPLVGRLFGHTTTNEDKRDLLILVTPHIVDDGEKLGPPSGADNR
ncbi:MAG: AMIN domain-containing protein [Gemmatimonadota bacterium]|nr:AMIN domain-containing protein [Gemmatimonadota bacterium]